MDQVEELQACLSIKKNELKQKNALANQKLKEMVKDQQEAEKVTSQEIQKQLRVQTQTIKCKREVVLCDLAKVEPAVSEWSAHLSSLLLSMCMKLPPVTGYFVPVLSKWPLTQTFVLAKKYIM